MQTAESVQVMEAGTARVEEGSRLATEAGAALRDILATVDQSVRAGARVQELSASAQEVAAYAQTLLAISQELRGQVERFRL